MNYFNSRDTFTYAITCDVKKATYTALKTLHEKSAEDRYLYEQYKLYSRDRIYNTFDGNSCTTRVKYEYMIDTEYFQEAYTAYISAIDQGSTTNDAFLSACKVIYRLAYTYRERRGNITTCYIEDLAFINDQGETEYTIDIENVNRRLSSLTNGSINPNSKKLLEILSKCTPIQRKILYYRSIGLSVRQIAEKLGKKQADGSKKPLSIGTISSHINTIRKNAGIIGDISLKSIPKTEIQRVNIKPLPITYKITDKRLLDVIMIKKLERFYVKPAINNIIFNK